MNFLQSQNWKESKKALGNQVFEVGEYFFHTTSLPVIKKNIGYMPRPDLKKIDLEELIRKGKESKSIYITIDPDNLKSDLDSIEFLKSKGLEVYPGSPIHLQKTVMIDLSLDEETLLSQQKQKTRYNLKLSQKKGVKVKMSNEDYDFEVFDKLYQETVQRQGYKGRSSHYLKTVWDQFKSENAFIATAYFEDKPIVSWFVISFDGILTYVYGGSSEEHKNVMAPYSVAWELIKLGKEYGYKYLDLFGIKNDESDGYSRFKVGFGGNVVEFANTVDVVIDSKMYKIIKVASKLRNLLLFKHG